MPSIKHNVVALALAGALTSGLAAATARADDFYSGKTVTFVVGFGVGGSYNAYSRLISAHMGRFLPGNPKFVVQNMPGAGSVRATNHLYAVAKHDGSVVGMIDQSIQAYELLGRKGLKAEVSKFQWLGRLVTNSAVLFSWHTSPIKKIEDALTTEFVVSATGAASRLNWTIMNNVIGTKIKMITGYKGTGESLLAMQRGEIQGLSRPWTALKSKQAEWLKQGKIRVLLQTGAEKNADLPNVPRMLDMARNEADLRLMKFFAGPSEVGRSVVAPPGVPAARVALLRDAFWKAIHDPKFKADLERTKLALEPLRGEDLQKLVAASRDVDPKLLARAKKIAASAPKRKRSKKKKAKN